MPIYFLLSLTFHQYLDRPVIAVSLKEPSSLLVWFLWKTTVGTSSLQGDHWKESPGSEWFSQMEEMFLSLCEIYLNCFPGEVPFNFCPWEDAIIRYFFTYSRKKGLSLVNRKSKQDSQMKGLQERISLLFILSIQIHRYLMGKCTKTFIGIPCLRKMIILIKDLFSCKQK